MLSERKFAIEGLASARPTKPYLNAVKREGKKWTDKREEKEGISFIVELFQIYERQEFSHSNFSTALSCLPTIRPQLLDERAAKGRGRETNIEMDGSKVFTQTNGFDIDEV